MSNNTVGLNGQWLGRFGGTTPGHIVLNVDALESTYEGVAYLLNDDHTLPVTIASFTVPGKKPAFETRTNYLLALDPKTMEGIPLEQIQPRFGSFSKYADVKGVLDGNSVQLTWKTDLGIEGNCTLNRSKAGEPSELRAEEMNWSDYKKFVAGMQAEALIFRGQNGPWRLRTSYHRLGRADMARFLNRDIPMLYRKLSARTGHVFNLNAPDENGAFLNLVQHHGYPTPLLDWTYSPYVAAFFAYRSKSNQTADTKYSKVRILIFDAAKWNRMFERYLQLYFPKLHITIAEFSAIENERLIPQQGVTMVTNIDDIETYVRPEGKGVRRAFSSRCGSAFGRAKECGTRAKLHGDHSGFDVSGVGRSLRGPQGKKLRVLRATSACSSYTTVCAYRGAPNLNGCLGLRIV